MDTANTNGANGGTTDNEVEVLELTSRSNSSTHSIGYSVEVSLFFPYASGILHTF